MGERVRPRFDRYVLRERAEEREESEDFQRLPVWAQDEYRRRWQRDVGSQVRRENDRWRFIARSALEGAVIFLVCKFLFAKWNTTTLMLAPAVGAATGLAWYFLRAKRFLCAFLAIPGYLLLGFMSTASGEAIVFYWAMIEGVAVLALCTALGSIREVRRGDHSVM